MPLRPISRMDDYRFPTEAWDVRGWPVRAEVGDEKVGKVEDMLLDSDGRLRYLEVDLGLMKKHVLVPLEFAHADRDDEAVWIDGMSKEQLERVPEYAVEPESLDEGYERRLTAFYGDATRRGGSRPLDVAADDERELELRRMETLEDEYEVAGVDPRGWDVVTADGQTVGEVKELLMDPGAMKARFLDVSVDEKKLDLERVDRHILLPAERVRLERNKKRVVVGGLLAGDVARYPQYGGLPVQSRSARELDEFFERPNVDEAVRREHDVRMESHPDDPSLRHFYGPRHGGPSVEERYHG
jgi:ribosomal 30S subunit maturation factor RimM